MIASVDLFKQALGSFPSGVTITSAFDREGHVVGMTASAFTSVSLDPLLILMCPSRGADCYRSLTSASFFSIHILGGDQVELAMQFANSGASKTEGLVVTRGPQGSPKIDGCLSYLECRHHALYDGGDHGILLGEVTYIEIPDTERAPLVYCRGLLAPLPPLVD